MSIVLALAEDFVFSSTFSRVKDVTDEDLVANVRSLSRYGDVLIHDSPSVHNRSVSFPPATVEFALSSVHIVISPLSSSRTADLGSHMGFPPCHHRPLECDSVSHL